MEELTRLRMERGWSQQRLADESSVNKATVNQIERGRRSPNVDTLEKLAGALGVGVADFFPKAQASLWSDNAPTERRSSMLIGGLRTYFWDLRLRWKEPDYKPSPEQIRDALNLLQHLVDSGAFEGPWTPKERFEIQVLFQAANKLKPIAEEFVDDNHEHLEQVFEEVSNLQELLSA